MMPRGTSWGSGASCGATSGWGRRSMSDDLIWRLEDEYGDGPYWTRVVRNREIDGDYYSEFRHPAPREDGIRVRHGSFPDERRFGFASISQARAWWYDPKD